MTSHDKRKFHTGQRKLALWTGENSSLCKSSFPTSDDLSGEDSGWLIFTFGIDNEGIPGLNTYLK